MKKKANMNEVKLKTRQMALMLGEFTVDDIIRNTGLKRSSINSELQRLKEKKYITSHPNPDRAKDGPRKLYTITSDIDKRMDLYESVEAFASVNQDVPLSEYPTSEYYTEAQQLIDLAEKSPLEQRGELLDRAEKAVDSARDRELVQGRHPLIPAYLGYETGRLQILRGDFAQAKTNMLLVRDLLVNIDNDIVIEIDRSLEIIDSHTITLSLSKDSMSECTNGNSPIPQSIIGTITDGVQRIGRKISHNKEEARYQLILNV